MDGRALDLGSIGCVLVERVMVQMFTCLPWVANQPDDERDDEHLVQLPSRLGPLPGELFARWTPTGRGHCTYTMGR